MHVTILMNLSHDHVSEALVFHVTVVILSFGRLFGAVKYLKSSLSMDGNDCRQYRTHVMEAARFVWRMPSVKDAPNNQRALSATYTT